MVPQRLVGIRMKGPNFPMRSARTPWLPRQGAGAGQRRGKLAPGHDADLVAWSVDPAAERGDGEAFRRVQAVLTVCEVRRDAGMTRLN
jgi:hypothetical protein